MTRGRDGQKVYRNETNALPAAALTNVSTRGHNDFASQQLLRAQVAELADALDSGAKTARLANIVPSTQPAENAGFFIVGRWHLLAVF
jgi:hypothetical protein